MGVYSVSIESTLSVSITPLTISSSRRSAVRIRRRSSTIRFSRWVAPRRTASGEYVTRRGVSCAGTSPIPCTHTVCTRPRRAVTLADPRSSKPLAAAAPKATTTPGLSCSTTRSKNGRQARSCRIVGALRDGHRMAPTVAKSRSWKPAARSILDTSPTARSPGCSPTPRIFPVQPFGIEGLRNGVLQCVSSPHS